MKIIQESETLHNQFVDLGTKTKRSATWLGAFEYLNSKLPPEKAIDVLTTAMQEYPGAKTSQSLPNGAWKRIKEIMKGV